MNILITGGAGFIGSHVAECLIMEKNIKKILIIDHLRDGSIKNIKNIISNKKIKFIKEDIRKTNKIKKYFKNINCVIHLAALSDIVPSIEEPKEYLENNIMGTISVLESMRYYGVKKIIYSASSSCYGSSTKVPTSENDSINPMYPYAFSKYAGEMVIKHWSQVYGINFISLRLFNVYGTRSRTHGAYGAALGVFLRQKISNKPLTIVGSGKQKRDFVYVKDVAEAFKKSVFSKVKNQIFNIGSSNPKTVNQLASLISNKKVFIPKRPGEPDITYANIKKANKKLNWFPRVKFEEGVKILLKDINYWKNATLWDKDKIYKATKLWFKYLK
jgi:UDP-glucose 4-epimerase